ncbi:hypothetical protein LTR62_001164 [Meristemomyces frigidus]|uniref:Inheritance of peroxisomes protein 1 n=1 Tax=Meristemomyces frigidus TaxID=1508187 RepID=A0AAN7TM22_9PEZI|nr:hypothetical protein LTR62_001164 [Meristemomyces frigidus]
MANTAPVTPETPRRVAMNRSFTVPSKLATSSQTRATAEVGASGDIETLYVHPNATIVKFSCSSRPSSASSPRAALSNTSGSLPWTSPTERTLASGPLEIYRVPGSVSFLHSGSLLHAILPRSQCWCVDKVSRFALRVLSDTYYRIDLPGDSPEDLEKVEELKVILAKVLFYERTACPFNRGEEEALPTAEELDALKKTRRRSHGPAKKWRLERGFSWRPEDGEVLPGFGSDGSRRESDTSSGEDAESGAENVLPQETMRESLAKTRIPAPFTPPRPSALFGMRSVTAPPQLPLPAITPSKLRVNLSPDAPPLFNESVVSQSPHLDPERLRMFQPIPTDMPPSPPDSSAGLGDRSESFEHHRQASEASLPMNGNATEASEQTTVEDRTLFLDADFHKIAPVTISADELSTSVAELSVGETADSPPPPIVLDRNSGPAMTLSAMSLPPSRPRSPAPPVTEGGYEMATLTRQRTPEDPYAAIQARILARRSIGGTTSFYPRQTSPSRSSTSSNSSTATITSRVSTQHQQNLASALVKKACAVFLGPPAHLVAIMLRIAASFASGALGFSSYLVYESPAGSKRVPGSFNLESIDADDFDQEEGGEDEMLDEWEEDDFGVPLRSPIRKAASARDGEGVRTRREREWDVE